MKGYIHVTEALELAGCADNTFTTETAKWRGSEVHRAAELLDRSRLKFVPDRLAGYLKAYEAFKREIHFVSHPDGIEQRVSIASLRLVGRLDRRGFIGGSPGIVDIKSGYVQPAARLQTALYGHGVDGGVWWTRYAVQLKEDGTYRVHKYPAIDYPRDLADALSAVRVAWWIKKNLRK